MDLREVNKEILGPPPTGSPSFLGQSPLDSRHSASPKRYAGVWTCLVLPFPMYSHPSVPEMLVINLLLFTCGPVCTSAHTVQGLCPASPLPPLECQAHMAQDQECPQRESQTNVFKGHHLPSTFCLPLALLQNLQAIVYIFKYCIQCLVTSVVSDSL